MGLRRTLILVLALAVTLVVGPVSHVRATGSVISAMIATPFEGHSGDVVYISGSGFAANTSEFISMACPDWADDTDGNLQQLVGPVTDRNGNFKAFPIQAVKLYHLPGSPCKIYANVGNDPFGVTIAANYVILAPNDPVARCARFICGKVHVDPVKLRPGQMAHIVVQTGGHGLGQSWPGAHANLTITINGTSIRRQRVSVGSDGRAQLYLRIPSRLSRDTSATVKVALHLGEYSGNLSAKFDLVRRTGISPVP